jgi:hypothetical protein
MQILFFWVQRKNPKTWQGQKKSDDFFLAFKKWYIYEDGVSILKSINGKIWKHY